MGRLFRVANSEQTDTYYFGDEGEEDRDWIRVRASINPRVGVITSTPDVPCAGRANAFA